jgi:hypothetical protein
MELTQAEQVLILVAATGCRFQAEYIERNFLLRPDLPPLVRLHLQEAIVHLERAATALTHDAFVLPPDDVAP